MSVTMPVVLSQKRVWLYTCLCECGAEFQCAGVTLPDSHECGACRGDASPPLLIVSDSAQVVSQVTPKRKLRACELCGNEFRPKNAQQKLCSDVCRKARRQAELESQRMDAIRGCKQCGTDFATRTYNKIFCSEKCRIESMGKSLFERCCPKCNREFTTTVEAQRYCSTVCAYDHKKEQRHEDKRLSRDLRMWASVRKLQGQLRETLNAD